LTFECNRRSHAALINFVFESAHRFPRGFNVNDFHRFPQLPTNNSPGRIISSIKASWRWKNIAIPGPSEWATLTVPPSGPYSRGYSCLLSSPSLICSHQRIETESSRSGTQHHVSVASHRNSVRPSPWQGQICRPELPCFRYTHDSTMWIPTIHILLSLSGKRIPLCNYR